MSSSEEDMTWEDFLASTDDLGESAKAAAIASATAMSGRRRGDGGSIPSGLNAGPTATAPRLLLPPNYHSSMKRISVTAGTGLGLGKPPHGISAGAAAAGAVVPRAVPQPRGSKVVPRDGNSGTMLSSRGKEAGASYSSGFTSWGNNPQEPNANDEESGESDSGLASSGGEVRGLRDVIFLGCHS